MFFVGEPRRRRLRNLDVLVTLLRHMDAAATIDAGRAARRRPHAVQLHQRAGGIPLGAAAVPRAEIAADRGPAADGDRGGFRARRLARAQPAARADRDPHPGGFRRPGFRLRRARHRAGGDGSGARLRAVFRLDRAGGDGHHECRHRRAETRAAAVDRRRRHDRDARLHRAERTLGCRRDRGDRDPGRGKIPARWRQEFRARRPHRRPDRGRGPPPGLGRRRRAFAASRYRATRRGSRGGR